MELDVKAKSGQRESGGCSCEGAQTVKGACAPTEDDSERREGKGPDRRLDRVERRIGAQRRKMSAEQAGYTGQDRRVLDDRRTGLERRRGPGRRRSDDRRSAEEGEMSEYQFEFVMAVQTYKKVNKKMYPTWTEILEIVNQLGYRKVLPRKIRLDMPEPPVMEI